MLINKLDVMSVKNIEVIYEEVVSKADNNEEDLNDNNESLNPNLNKK